MKSFVIFCAIFTILENGVFGQDKEHKPIKAIAVITGPSVAGNVSFTQSGCGQPVFVEIVLVGLSFGEHGFHVHEKGDLSQGCASFGGHFNPDKLDHGARTAEIRHVGDLGNVNADANGRVITSFSDSVISLTGPNSIIGRGIVVHDGVDDLGLGSSPDSKKTGNAGGRAGCGVIGLQENDDELDLTCRSAGHKMFGSLTIIILILPLLATLLHCYY